MARRNVQLIISAKNDAERVLRSLNGALEDFAKRQVDAAKASGGLNSNMQRQGMLATSSARVIEQAYSKITQSVKKADGAMSSTKAALTERRAAYTALAAQSTAAGKAIKRAEDQIGRVGESDFLVRRLKAAKEAYKQLQRETKAAAREMDRADKNFRDSADELGRVERQALAAEVAMKSLAASTARARSLAARTSGAAATQRGAGLIDNAAIGQQQRLAAAFRGTDTAGNRVNITVNQVVRSIAGLGPATARATGGLRSTTAATRGLRRAMQEFYGDSRRALSLMQRIRGEALSMTASFIGFYAIFNEGRNVFEAFRTIEGAQNRLGAAFQQNSALVGREMAFLRAEAQRLGISFATLSDSYSKFLISARAANFTTNETRDVFRSVAEAGRVMNLSNDQVSGVLTALTQIAGKGTLQMEELRQQLGDRLPGAVALMARALGYGTEELAQFYKDVENGQIDAKTALTAFGAELDKTFGGQLSQALTQVTADMGRFQDNLFKARNQVAVGGFMDGLQEALQRLNQFFASDEGEQFFLKLGAAAGNFMQIVPILVENLDVIFLLFKGLVALKVARFMASAAGSMGLFQTRTFAARRAIVQTTMATAGMSAGMSTANVRTNIFGLSLRRLTVMMATVRGVARSMWLALGGPIGVLSLAITALMIGPFSAMATEVDGVNEVLYQHEEAIGAIQAAYASASGDQEAFTESLSEMSSAEMINNIARLTNTVAELRKGIGAAAGNTGSFANKWAELYAQVSGNEDRELIVGLRDAIDDFAAGTGAVDGMSDAMDRLLEAGFAPGGGFLGELSEVIADAGDTEEALAMAEAGLRVLMETATQADRDLLGVSEAFEEVSESVDPAIAKTAEFNEKIRELQALIPSMKEEMDRLEDVEAIQELTDQAIQLALEASNVKGAWDELVQAMKNADAEAAGSGLWDLVTGLGGAAGKIAAALGMGGLAQQGLVQTAADQEFGSFTDGVEAAMALIRSKESFEPVPYNDPQLDSQGQQRGRDIARGGYGSNTITNPDGTTREIGFSDRVTIQQAEDDLYRRVTTEFMPKVAAAVGDVAFEALNAQQQAALTSIAYNYGSLPGSVARAVRDGTTEEVEAAIRGLGSHNGGINRGRRNQEAAIFGSTAGAEGAVGVATANREAVVDENERLADIETQRLEDAEAFRAGNAQDLETARLRASFADEEIIARETALALASAEREAAALGLTLSEQERDTIKERVRIQFEGQQSDAREALLQEQAAAVQEQINTLQERKAYLQERLAVETTSGDSEAMAQTESEIDTVNEALEEAIANAREFWATMGGPEAEAALESLDRTEERLRRLAATAGVSGKEMNDLITNKLSAAVNSFAQAVASGENVWKSLGTAIRTAAGEILIEIGQMIAKQLIYNAVSGAFGGGAGGGGGLGSIVASGINAIVRHSGGMGTSTGMSRRVNPALFTNAVRYHGGGMPGLSADESAAIIKKNERVLNEEETREYMRGEKGGKGGGRADIYNLIDSESFLDAALASEGGANVILNHVKANRASFKAALE